jgi:hypothetical protein
MLRAQLAMVLLIVRNRTLPKQKNMKKRTSILFSSVLAVLTGSVGAAITVTGSNNDSAGFTVSATDLLQTQMTGGNSSVNDTLIINTAENNAWTGASGPFTNPAGNVGNLTDGDFSFASNAGFTGSAGAYTISGGTITFNLNTSINTLGYDISDIGIYTGWVNDGRDGINVEVFYATVGAPSTYVSLGTAVHDGLGRYASAVYTETVSPNLLATGVRSIRFSFGTQENSGVGYKELDVTGVATIPEPSAALFGGLGVLALRRRRA